MTTAPTSISRQGNYAGPISRLAAFAADMGIAWVALLVIVGAIGAAISLITGKHIKINQVRFVGAIIVGVWYFLYFAYQWALGGRTLGMAFFGLKVVTADGATIGGRQAVIRTLTLPISIIVFWLGLLGIVFRVDHRAWHDRFAGTCVIYDWDARAARLRWLARQHEQLSTGDVPRNS